jgi:hypothetical protein
LFAIFLYSEGAHAATITAASCSSSDVQAAINSAANGDTVKTPGPCSNSWSSAVSIPSNKGITVDGGGNTTLSSFGFTLSQGSATSRITGFTFTGPGNNGQNGQAVALNISGSPSSVAFRVDHNTFTANSQSVFIAISGNGPGLLDHNSLTGGGASEMIHNLGLGASNNGGWSDSVAPGSDNMVYVEDNTFTDSDPTFIASGLQSYNGARTVVRHNTFNFSQIDQHGTPGMIGARWWEVYENTFNAQGKAQCCYMVLRGGSGVIFNNHKAGSNGAPGGIQLIEEDSGYPALYQIGRGINESYSPAYVWGNDSTIPVGSGSSNVVEGRDFMLSAAQPGASMLRQEASSDTSSTTYGYTPYTYPHPLQAGQSTPPVQGGGPQPPSSLSAIVQ